MKQCEFMAVRSGRLSGSGPLGRKAHLRAVLAMTASLAAASGQAQEKGHVVNDAPDYVATREYSGPPSRQVNLRHHGGWLRVDDERTSYFEGPGRRVWFTRALDADSDRCRPGFRDDLAHHSDLKSPTRSEMMSPTIPG